MYAKSSLAVLAPFAASSFIPNTAQAQCGAGAYINTTTYNGYPDNYIDLDGDGSDDFNIFQASSFVAIFPLGSASVAYFTAGPNSFRYASNLTGAVNLTALNFTSNAASGTISGYGQFGIPSTGFIAVIVNGNFGFLQISIDASRNTTFDMSMSGVEDAVGGTDGPGTVTMGNCATLLPVELTYLRAESKNQEVALQWQTAAEINNQGFEIQRSMNGTSFQKVGWVDGEGNSERLLDYEFMDSDVKANVTYYYRLKQMDFDGNYEYSEVVNAMYEDKDVVSVNDFYPNPVNSGIVRLDIALATDEQVAITVFNQAGQIVLEKQENVTIGLNQLELNVEALPSGTYFTKVLVGNGEAIYKKLMITD